ncbi:hypothetical protein EJ08DRAFT_664998 [Tothia fuscella]|uniref:Uncharacterized protein n=1 Tax=Tothia fuscella TaxID=1048955 RepID=A0A9P4NHG7_9PEZI|nr:hypothetical protein EJ08DRAFT_664998 [Tothia fuscella]
MRTMPLGASVALGVLVGLVSTGVQSIGLTHQRKSHLLEDQKSMEEDGHVARPAYKRRRWQVGMLMFLVANIVGSSIQITTLPLPVLSTLQAVSFSPPHIPTTQLITNIQSGLVFNTICATIILGEPFTRYSIIGTCLVATGAVLIGIFGSVTEPSHNLDQLLYLLSRSQFLIWLFGTLFVAIFLMLGTFMLKRIPPRYIHRVRFIEGMLYGSISGIFSAHGLLLAKAAVELLVRTIADRHNQFNRWQSYMILFGFLFFALSQLYYMHLGLKLCSTSVLYPFVFCIYNIVTIIDGLIYFDQGSRLPPLHAGLIAVGTVVLLAGVFALSWRLQADGQIPGPAAVDVRAKARVPTPRAGLAPGLGLLDSGESEDEDGHVLRYSNDEEAARPSEHTPLLRSATAPAVEPSTVAKRRAGTLNLPKSRRKTTVDATSEIWDELHDRSDTRRYSGGPYSPHSMRSPSSSRLLERRRASGGPQHARTMPTRRSKGFSTFTEAPWKFLGNTIRGNGSNSNKNQKTPIPRFESPPPLSDGPTDGEDTEGEHEVRTGRGRGWSLGGREPDNSSNMWMKLKWWKKRWRSSDSEQNGVDDT